MNRLKSIWILLSLLAALSASAVSEGFDRYQVILDRKPFGVPPPPAPVKQEPVVPVQVPSFARNLRLSMIVREETGELKVGIVDLSTSSGMSMQIGEIQNGIELVSADYDAEEAVLRRGTEMALIKLTGAEATDITSSPAGAAKAPTPSRPRPALPVRAAPRTRTPAAPASPAVNPKLSGQELKKHLQDYQMEVIRQGLPPLPIPLTQEQDDQLVLEGVLPPSP